MIINYPPHYDISMYTSIAKNTHRRIPINNTANVVLFYQIKTPKTKFPFHIHNRLVKQYRILQYPVPATFLSPD